MSQTVRSILVALVGGAVLALVLDRVVKQPDFQFPKDFLEYWAAGRLNLRGENPYDAKQLLAEQRTAQPDREHAVMMWNPPPSLAVYMPLGLAPARWASLVWVGVQFAAAMLACYLLWRVYGNSRVWLSAVAGIVSVGTWWVVAYGQNTGLIVLGLAGFLYYSQRGKPVAAGAFAALTALKPHLLAGFGVLLIADVLRRRGLVALVTGAGVVVLALGVAVVANPDVVEQFIAVVRDPGPGATPLHDWHLPVPSWWLRVSITGQTLGPEGFWIQFVPCAVACVALLAWRVRAGRDWDWVRAMPVVVAMSVLTTPYGGWIFDLPVLLVPVVWCTARLAHDPLALGVFLSGQFVIVIASFATAGALQNYWWIAPALLGLCLLGFTARPGGQMQAAR
jgi:hypothetical protein